MVILNIFTFLLRAVIIIFLLIVGLIYLIFKLLASGESEEEALKRHFGPDYKKAIEEGNLSYLKAYPCDPSSARAELRHIQEVSNVKTDFFHFVSCDESLIDFGGDHNGGAELSFDPANVEEFLNEVRQSINSGNTEWSIDGDTVTYRHEGYPDTRSLEMDLKTGKAILSYFYC